MLNAQRRCQCACGRVSKDEKRSGGRASQPLKGFGFYSGEPLEGSGRVKCNLTSILKRSFWGFPGGAVVESLPANAGDTGSSPGLGRSRMPRSGWAREPHLLSLRVWSLCSATREAAIVRGRHTAMKSGPRSPQLEKALAQKRRLNTAIKINKLIN